MATLRQEMQKGVECLPRLALRQVVEKKLAAAGADLPDNAIDELVSHIMARDEDDHFTWTSGEDDSGELKNITLSFDAKDAAEIEASVDKVLSDFPAIMQKALTESGELLFRQLRTEWEHEGARQRLETDAFRERLEERWGEGLMLLRMLLTCCREIGASAHKSLGRSKKVATAYRRHVLCRLHARTCQVAEEVITLMENGLADGAMARWRTLHELAVVAAVIAAGDDSLAERYLDHDAVDLKKQADDHDLTLAPLGHPPVAKATRRALEKTYVQAIAKHGPDFGSPYGWAAEAVGKKRPTFRDLQKAADHASQSAAYKIASHTIHAGARGVFFRLSDLNNSGAPIAGRCNAGLAEPGGATASALTEITGWLLGDRLSFERLVELECVLKIRDAAPIAFEKADRRLRRDERDRQTALKKRRDRYQTMKSAKA